MTPPPKSRKQKRQEVRESQERLVEQLEARLRQMTEESAAWKKKYEETREKEANLRAKRKEEKRKRFQYYNRMVPIIAAVVLKSVYERAVGIGNKRWYGGKRDDRDHMIRNLHWRFAQIGYENAQQVDGLADIWSGVMEARNTAAHQVRGEDVIDILPYCDERLRHVLETAFWLLWGIAPGHWHFATPEQKGLVLRKYGKTGVREIYRGKGSAPVEAAATIANSQYRRGEILQQRRRSTAAGIYPHHKTTFTAAGGSR
ncbi:hypothetical protein HOY80DRAFT_1040679 [Tuber brumale]|nr:hypothetical protein HOY80DRAFT_1040679 [Tuber brumale]